MIRRSVLHLKSPVFRILGSGPALARRLNRLHEAGLLTILNLHRVDDQQESAYEAMDPAVFSELAGWLKTRFEILTFAELADWKPGNRPPLVMSFDDGYKDFIDIVVPILKRHGLRANQNIIPGCIESGRPPLNVMLQDFIGTAPAALLREFEVPGLPNGVNPDDRIGSGRRASAAVKNHPYAKQLRLFERLYPQFERFDGFRTTPLMSREDVRQIATLHEIGAHSYDHASMAAETDAYLTNDLTRCRAYCDEILGLPVNIYAFPNGSCRAGQAEIVRNAGFEHVLLVNEDFSDTRALAHKRFTTYGKRLAEARFRAVGGFRHIPTAR